MLSKKNDTPAVLTTIVSVFKVCTVRIYWDNNWIEAEMLAEVFTRQITCKVLKDSVLSPTGWSFKFNRIL